MSEQRASDADRERAADRLRRAGGDGRLSVDELDDRVALAYAARTFGELEALVRDLPETTAVTEPGRAGGTIVRPGAGGARWIIAVLAATTRAGRWRVAPRCVVVNVLGGADIDLNEAELAADDVRITIFSLLGGSDVYVPQDLSVDVTDLGLLGGNDVERGAPTAGPDSAPVVHLRLISVLGGTNVRRGSRQTRRQRRAGRHLLGH